MARASLRRVRGAEAGVRIGEGGDRLRRRGSRSWFAAGRSAGCAVSRASRLTSWPSRWPRPEVATITFVPPDPRPSAHARRASSDGACARAEAAVELPVVALLRRTGPRRARQASRSPPGGNVRGTFAATMASRERLPRRRRLHERRDGERGRAPLCARPARAASRRELREGRAIDSPEGCARLEGGAMQLQVKGKNLDLTPDLVSYAERKIGKLEKLLADPTPVVSSWRSSATRPSPQPDCGGDRSGRRARCFAPARRPPT